MAKKVIKRMLQLGGIDVSRHNPVVSEYRKLYNKYRDYTMIPEDEFILNLDLVSKFFEVNGDIVECGVWRGGMVAAIAELANNEKTFHLFDSFEGLPPAKEIDGQAALDWQSNTTSSNYYDNCTADESFAIAAMKLAGHKRYKIYKGWFQETLPQYQHGAISVLRLDGDWYDSIKNCLEVLFPKLTTGGIVIIDDYYTWDGCSRAVHDYLSQNQLASRIYQWKGRVGYIIK